MKYTTILLTLLPALGYAQDAYGPHCAKNDASECQAQRCIDPTAGSFSWSANPVCVVPCKDNTCADKCRTQAFDRKFQVGYCHSIGNNHFCVCTDKTFF